MADTSTPGAVVPVTSEAGPSRLSGPSLWEFWTEDQAGSKVGEVVTLRVPPQAMEIHRPIRSQVSQDLGRNAVVVLDGMGLVRWTLSGTHGSGTNVVGTVTGQGLVSDGLRARLELLGLFTRWAEDNVTRTQAHDPKGLLRLVLSISGGGPSETPFDEWEIVPEEAPRDKRSASGPMAWNWSMSFWGIRHRSEAPPAPRTEFLILDPYKISNMMATRLPVTLDAALLKPSILDRIVGYVAKVRALVQKVQAVRATVAAILAGGKGLLKTLCDQALSLAKAVTGIIKDIKAAYIDGRGYLVGSVREMHDTLMSIRFTAGELALMGRKTTGASAYPTTRALTLSVHSGDTVQGMALRVYGDAGRWQELADLNHLDYPYFDFSGPENGPDPALIAAGRRVLGEGSSLVLPLVDGADIPSDPIGWDRSESGAMDVVMGTDNLRGALLRRLRTPAGWLPYHDAYGSNLRRFVGQAQSVSGVLAIRREVVNTLLRDPRVLKVLAVRTRVDADAVWVEADVSTPLGPLQVAGNIA